jgi:DNA recombination protein RmuC
VTTFLAGAAVGAAGMLILWLWNRQHLAARIARLEAERDAALRAITDQRDLLGQTELGVRQTFAALSREALHETRGDLLQSANALLAPVRDTLDRVQAHLTDVDRAREGSHQAVVAQLRSLVGAQEQLRQTTETLSRALRSPNVRGKWGEIQLRRILELAGMLHQCDFVEKESAPTNEGTRQTPDVVVRLPGGSNVVVDSKVPIDAYLAAASAKTDAERAELVALHTRQVRDHIRALGAKEYWRRFEPSPEFVVMFLPLEPLLSTAFEHDGTLLEQAAALRVIPATPMTLLALLKAVAYGWQQQSVASNAEEIQNLGRELYDRLAVMVEHLEGVGRNLKAAADSYDRFVGSLEQKVVPSARRFRDLGVSTTKTIESPEQLALTLRKVRKDELSPSGKAEDAPGEVVQAESRFRQ